MTDIEKMDFEGALSDLEAIVRRLEGGTLSLGDSLDSFERAIALVKRCNECLDGAKRRVAILTESADGTVSDRPFETEE